MTSVESSAHASCTSPICISHTHLRGRRAAWGVGRQLPRGQRGKIASTLHSVRRTVAATSGGSGGIAVGAAERLRCGGGLGVLGGSQTSGAAAVDSLQLAAQKPATRRPQTRCSWQLTSKLCGDHGFSAAGSSKASSAAAADSSSEAAADLMQLAAHKQAVRRPRTRCSWQLTSKRRLLQELRWMCRLFSLSASCRRGRKHGQKGTQECVKTSDREDAEVPVASGRWEKAGHQAGRCQWPPAGGRRLATRLGIDPRRCLAFYTVLGSDTP
eukprot:365713-Chlamydomonas_euryale.AAC.4